MNPHVNAITNRSILLPPQRISLEILARVSELIPLKKKEKHEGHAGEMLKAGVSRDIYTLKDGKQFCDKGFGSGSNRSNS